MANRNLADEVDALAKGLASLRAANKRLAARFATFEAKRNDEVVSLEIPVADFERSMAAVAAKSAAAAEWREAYRRAVPTASDDDAALDALRAKFESGWLPITRWQRFSLFIRNRIGL